MEIILDVHSPETTTNIWFGNNYRTLDNIATRIQKLTSQAASRKQITNKTLETRQQILHALAAICMQSRQFFASTLREQLFE
jgi:hypothetical protein